MQVIFQEVKARPNHRPKLPPCFEECNPESYFCQLNKKVYRRKNKWCKRHA